MNEKKDKEAEQKVKSSKEGGTGGGVGVQGSRNGLLESPRKRSNEGEGERGKEVEEMKRGRTRRRWRTA